MSNKASSIVALFGRSSSSFTRVVRLFAAELGVEYEFQIVRDLMSRDPSEYGGSPALKLPVLHLDHDAYFGALNICRTLHRYSKSNRRILWPETLQDALLANAQELTTHAMNIEVTLVMATLAGDDSHNAYQDKMMLSLTNSMTWLDRNVLAIEDRLMAERDLSFLEVTLFCLIAHLEFRRVLSMTPYPHLSAFSARFGARSSAQAADYCFDVI